MGLNLAASHATGIEEQDSVVIKARPAVLVLTNKLWLECTQAVTGNFNGVMSKIAFKGFAALAVPGIAGGVCDGGML